MYYKFWRTLKFFVLAILSVGCQSYEPKPLNIGGYQRALEARVLDYEPISSFANRLTTVDHAPAKFDFNDGITSEEGEIVALFYNPTLRLSRQEASISLANFETAGLWKDPVFGFTGAEISSPSAPFQFGITGNITIPISGRLEIEKDRAGVVYNAELRKLVDAEWNTRAQLRSQWAAWSGAKLQVELVLETIEQIERINSIAESLHEAGEINRVELRLLRVELTQHKVKEKEASLQLFQLETNLLHTLGLPQDATALLIPAIPVLELTAIQDETARLIDANTELAVTFAEYQIAEESLRLEIKKQYPDIEFGLGYGSESNDHRVLFGLSVPISIWNRNQAGIATANKERDLARVKSETTFTKLYQELALANEKLRLIESQRGYFEDEIVPLLDQQAFDIENIISLGEVDMFILLETITRQFEAKTQLVELQVEEAKAAIEIHRILGPEYQLNPARIHEDQPAIHTLGGVQ
ncbi:MAG: TolC family protein [Phycisphaerales bacterium]|nr:TolC family protein [Phycisphaerales bacterium]